MSISYSIIIPFKNSQETLKKCIDSVLRQSYNNFEIILVDDHSEDNSRDIVAAYEKSHTKIVVYGGQKFGVSAARNLGIYHAKNDYICFVDSDDYVQDDYLATFNELISDSPEMAISGIYVNGRGKSKFNGKLNRIEALKLLFYNEYFEGYPVNKAFNNRILKKHNIKFNEDLIYSEDLLFCYTYIMNISSVRYDSHETYNYVVNPNSVTSKNNVDQALLGDGRQTLKALDIISSMNKYNQLSKIITTRKVWAYSLISRRITAQRADRSYKKLKIEAKHFIKINLIVFLFSNVYRIKDKLMVTIDLVSSKLMYKLWSLKK